jgi:hypothetical protein
MQDAFEALVVRVARMICAKTDTAAKDSPIPIYDVPDDLVWLDSATGPVLAARWQLYEARARAVLADIGFEKKLSALTIILHEVQRARFEDKLPDLALLEKVASAALE